MSKLDLLVGKIVKRKHFKKRQKPKQSPKSDTVRYFDSLQNRSSKLSLKQVSIYEKWTINIRRQMESKKIWPIGMEDWTAELIAEYVRLLQLEFCTSIIEINKKFKRMGIYQRDNELYFYPFRYIDQINTFACIYGNKLRRKMIKLGIGHLASWRSHRPLWTNLKVFRSNDPRDNILKTIPIEINIQFTITIS